jgi:hypothetical protein
VSAGVFKFGGEDVIERVAFERFAPSDTRQLAGNL